MLGIGGNQARAVLDALSRSLAIIEFEPSGIILKANENFCRVVGYELSEIVGQHHRMFVDAVERESAEYKQFWSNLAKGAFEAREFRRIGKHGREIWIQASYNPVIGSGGAVTKVVKIATEITDEKLRNAEFESKIAAISRVQAVIEFAPSGEVLSANENFLDAMGYSLSEVVGQHHRMFCEPDHVESEAYRDHWRRLNAGEFVVAEFKRIAKRGKPVWIQASYNPIFGADGKVRKVVKFATVVTDRVDAVNDLGSALSHLAANDLTHEIVKPFAAAFEPLRLDFNHSVQQFRSIIRQVSEVTANIETGTKEISTAADDLSRRTEGNAANLEETAAALSQITTTVKTSAAGAEEARVIVLAADEETRQGATVVRSAMDAMEAIARSSLKISQIIGVIDEIAFQTNLLALNAGVEAARAGEAGRGFAVVASEVRALAQRSAEAAKEIKALISQSGMQVDNGVKLVSATGSALERIMKQVSQISGVVMAIAAGAKDQALGLGEIDTAVSQMDRSTQQNAAMVEESTAACRLLTEEASSLAGLVQQFRIEEAAASSRYGKPVLIRAA